MQTHQCPLVPNVPQHTALRQLKLLLSGVLVCGLLACGGGGGANVSTNTSSSAKYQGTFVDSQVKNLAWRTSTRSGVTDSQGRFGFDTPGELITFSIGGMDLGVANADTSIHVFDLENATPELSGIKGARLAQLLQTLDIDHDASNGIILPDNIHNQFASDTDIQIIGSDTVWNAKLNQMAAVYGVQPVNAETAYAHAISNIPAASTNCAISDRTYPALVGGSFSTAGMGCVRKAQLAALYEKVIPDLQFSRTDMLNDSIISNGEDITKAAIDKSLETNALRSGFQSFYDIVDSGVSWLDEARKGIFTTKAIGAAANLAVPLLEAIGKMECATESCKDELNKQLLVPKVLAFIADVASCKRAEYAACADAVDKLIKERGLFESFGYKPTLTDYVSIKEIIQNFLPSLKVFADFAAPSAAPNEIPARLIRLAAELSEASIKMATGSILRTGDENYQRMKSNPSVIREWVNVVGEQFNIVLTCKASSLAHKNKSEIDAAKYLNECLHKGAEFLFKYATTNWYAGQTLGAAKAVNDAASDINIRIAVLQELYRRDDFPSAFKAYGSNYSTMLFAGEQQYVDYATSLFLNGVASAVNESLYTRSHEQLIALGVANSIAMVNIYSKKFQEGSYGSCIDVSMDDLTVVGVMGGLGKAAPGEQIGVSSTALGAGILGYLVTWGDGISTISNAPAAVHTYGGEGIYQVRIMPYLQSANGLRECTSKAKFATVSISSKPEISSSTTLATMYQTISFWITNVYSAINYVIWNFGAGIADKTVSVADSVTFAVSQVFSTIGDKTITAIFKDTADNVLGQASVTFTVGQGKGLTTAITIVQDNRNIPSVDVANNGTTADATPVFRGTIGAPLPDGYQVRLFKDSDVDSFGVATVSGLGWSFTVPGNQPLANGSHSITAGVVLAADGSTAGGARSAPFLIKVSAIAATTTKLPHSGITASQCYQASSDTLVDCTSSAATALNSQQDGMRTSVSHMAYSLVPKASGGSYDKTECVKDNVTGLMWEGKTASGTRAGSNVYTNYDSTSSPQKSNGSAYVNPTQSEVDASTNSVGYVAYVNSVALCGYTDWRLPTVDELQTIVDYGVAYPGPTINTAWFPNTAGNVYWASSPLVGNSNDAWGVGFDGGGVGDRGFGGRSGAVAVRLVRASQ